jgi:hypothetical protein
MLKAIILALPLLAGPASAWAADFNDKTPCSVLVAAVDKFDVMDVRRSSRYIQDAFLAFDHIQASGDHNTLGKLISAAESRTMERDVLTLCASEPAMPVRDAAKAVYITASIFGPS